MTRNQRISELILEIEFGMNKVEVKADSRKESSNLNKKIENKVNENLLKLERAFFDNFSNEAYSNFE